MKNTVCKVRYINSVCKVRYISPVCKVIYIRSVCKVRYISLVCKVRYINPVIYRWLILPSYQDKSDPPEHTGLRMNINISLDTIPFL